MLGIFLMLTLITIIKFHYRVEIKSFKIMLLMLEKMLSNIRKVLELEA